VTPPDDRCPPESATALGAHGGPPEVWPQGTRTVRQAGATAPHKKFRTDPVVWAVPNSSRCSRSRSARAGAQGAGLTVPGARCFSCRRHAPEPRLAEAAHQFRDKQQSDGSRLLESARPELAHFKLEDGDGEPSHWNTLRALRVLRWHGAAQP